jgi:hypothetical protein
MSNEKILAENICVFNTFDKFENNLEVSGKKLPIRQADKF